VKETTVMFQEKEFIFISETTVKKRGWGGGILLRDPPLNSKKGEDAQVEGGLNNHEGGWGGKTSTSDKNRSGKFGRLEQGEKIW